MRTIKGIIEAFVVLLAILAAFALGREWENYQQELEFSQAKGQCHSIMDKTRYAAKGEDGWVCFIQHWEDKKKPRITMSRLTIDTN